MVASAVIFLFNGTGLLQGMISKGKSTKEIDPRPDQVFIELYGKNTNITISNEDIVKFKEAFTQKNKIKKKHKRGFDIDGIGAFIRHYNHIYEQQQDENINRNFIDEVFPVLFRDYFDLDIKEGQSLEQLLTSGLINPYVMNYFFYDTYSHLRFDEYCRESYFTFILNGARKSGFWLEKKFCEGNNYDENSNYLKAILTPSASRIAGMKKQKKVLQKLFVFMLCMKHLPKSNFPLSSPKFPPCKSVINRIIVPLIIKNNISKRTASIYQERRNLIKKHWPEIHEALGGNGSRIKEEEFERFNTWMDVYLDPAQLIYSDIKKRMDEKK